MITRIYERVSTRWNNRHNLDTPERRSARVAVTGLTPAVVITGASKGIGFELAKIAVSAGDTVLLIARSQPDLVAVAEILNKNGNGQVFTLACDIASSDATSRIDAALAEHKCYLDVLINNAAMGLSGPFLEHAAADLDQLIETNMAALTRLMRHALSGMMARGRGGILNVGSLGGSVPGPNQAAYYASKSYVKSLTEAVASEIAGSGVRVAVVVPGPVGTGFHAGMAVKNPLYRLLLPELTPESVARAAYRGFHRGQRVIVPNAFYLLFYGALRVLPHPLTVPVTGWLLKNR